MIRIMGIDPGSRFTGVGIIDTENNSFSYVHHQTIVCGNGDFPGRLKTIFVELNDLIQQFKPDEIGIETVFMAKNAGAALKLGQARGAAVCASVANDVPVFEYAPRAIKQAVVGKGAADKTQVQYMVALLLSLKNKIQEDAADALAVSICHANSRWANQRLAGLT
ncbi:MAG: crossover junction endodeoxyribonuclease RuvC [Proteobacteria bacterium]|nr:crossover junction endodeoxyribonuclease RuvC [Pseudomonadota bacterium]